MNSLSLIKKIFRPIKKTLDSGQYILGKNVLKFEKNFANYIKTKYAVGVANGTDGIELALRSLDIGVGDEVATVSHTAMATVSAILSTGRSQSLLILRMNFLALITILFIKQ